jgi:hypothetical protein
MKKGGDEAVVKQALDFWAQRNAPMLKDAQTNEPLRKNPLQVLKTYIDNKNLPVEQLMEEVDWHYFDEGSTSAEVFGTTLQESE